MRPEPRQRPLTPWERQDHAQKVAERWTNQRDPQWVEKQAQKLELGMKKLTEGMTPAEVSELGSLMAQLRPKPRSQ